MCDLKLSLPLGLSSVGSDDLFTEMWLKVSCWIRPPHPCLLSLKPPLAATRNPLLPTLSPVLGWLTPGGMWLMNISECHLQFWVVGFSVRAARGASMRANQLPSRGADSCRRHHLATSLPHFPLPSSRPPASVGQESERSLAPGPAPLGSHYIAVELTHRHTTCLSPSITMPL